ncbi:tyrosine-type recombinase/integrase [Nocardia sp. NPDC004340]
MAIEHTIDLAMLLPSWELALRAERKSDHTVNSYLYGVHLYLGWCAAEGHPPELDRHQVNAFVANLLTSGLEPATARARQLALRRFSVWLVEEDELDSDPLLGLKPPKLDEKVSPALTDDQIKGLLKACQGKDFRDRRDEAIIRLLLETAMRAGECANIDLTDMDIRHGLVTVQRGKGGKGGIVPFGLQTGRSSDRYIRARRTHRLADSPKLWLGERSKGFSYWALYATLTYRAELAGIEDFHPHVLRHTGASRWLGAGGTEGGLMAIAGWSTRDMIDRYTKSTAAARAAEEARGLNLGDL